MVPEPRQLRGTGCPLVPATSGSLDSRPGCPREARDQALRGSETFRSTGGAPVSEAERGRRAGATDASFRGGTRDEMLHFSVEFKRGH